MTLKDLQLKLQKHSVQQNSIVEHKPDTANINVDIAKNIVDKLYGHVIKSVSSDRSRVKLNMFEKAAISSGLNRMAPGTKGYLEGMRVEDIKSLLADILICYPESMLQEELDRRAKR